MMDALRAVRAVWIPLFYLGHLASAQVAELSQEEQLQKLEMAAYRCYQDIITKPVVLTGLYCNRTWDNVMCWPDTAADIVGYQRCPSYINGFDHAEYATKHCLENGTWFTSPTSGKPWTNYTACYAKGPTQDNNLPALIVEHMPGIKLMYTIGYTLSLAALILAVSIMVYFKKLHCSRNMIHLNMFLAFLVRAAFSLIRTVLMVKDLGFPDDVNNTGERLVFIQEGTHWECKLFFTLFYYIIFASVMWLFNEGLYLVLILSVSVFAEKTKVRWFVLLGWGSPVIFIIPWVICRIEFDDRLCWNVHVEDKLFWILNGPMVASVAVNFAFFIVIIRMLFTKLTAINCPDSKKVRYRKLAKSTLILIPLFAVYYMGFIWLPDGLSPASDLFKLYVEMLFNSFQGFLVALLFCFLNAEVQNEIRKKWHVLRRRDSWRSQPSNGSFLRGGRSGARTGNPRDGGRRHSQSRSFLDSSVATREQHFPHTITTSGQPAPNGHMPAIGEQSTLLGDAAGSREVSIPLCLRQDFGLDSSSALPPPLPPNPPDNVEDVADTGFSEDSSEDVPGSDPGDKPEIRHPSPSPRGEQVPADSEREKRADIHSKDVFKGNSHEDVNKAGCYCDVIRKSNASNYNGNLTGTCDVRGFNDEKCTVEVYNTDYSNSCDVDRSNASGGKTCDEDCGGELKRSSQETSDFDSNF